MKSLSWTPLHWGDENVFELVNTTSCRLYSPSGHWSRHISLFPDAAKPRRGNWSLGVHLGFHQCSLWLDWLTPGYILTLLRSSARHRSQRKAVTVQRRFPRRDPLRKSAFNESRTSLFDSTPAKAYSVGVPKEGYQGIGHFSREEKGPCSRIIRLPQVSIFTVNGGQPGTDYQERRLHPWTLTNPST